MLGDGENIECASTENPVKSVTGLRYHRTSFNLCTQLNVEQIMLSLWIKEMVAGASLISFFQYNLLKVAGTGLQHLNFDGPMPSLFISWYHNNGLVQMPNYWWRSYSCFLHS